MTLDEIAEITSKTLAELGVQDADSVGALFTSVRAALDEDAAKLAGAADYEALRDRWLSRKNGIVTRINERWLKSAPRELKRSTGIAFNELHRRALEIFSGTAAIKEAEAKRDEGGGLSDLTFPGVQSVSGSLHPITQVEREIEEIFLRLGFAIETGPEIETVYYNFDALNIPESHPSRDDWDTLYIDSNTVLRTHTSPVQVRAMQKSGAPLYILIPGTCYRRDNPDSTHSPVFHQIEGLAVDENITFADLKGTLDFFARSFFGGETKTSFHPSYFPFTEPSGEVSISCPFCAAAGCRVCKQSGWIEVMGCGMVHPEVLRHGGIDPAKYTGWAFGLGVERYAMLKYGINDIQLFYQSDVRFLEQF